MDNIISSINNYENACIKIAFYGNFHLAVESFIDSKFRGSINEKEFHQWREVNKTVLSQLSNQFANFNNWTSAYGPNKSYFIAQDPLKNQKICVIDYGGKVPAKDDEIVNEIAFLKGVGKIPSFKVVLITEAYKPDLYPKEFGHDNYLSEAFQYMFLGQLIDDIDDSKPPRKITSQEIFQLTKEFLLNNKHLISRLSKNIQSSPQFLGGGADGAAFSIGPNRVLKIFKDEISFIKAEKAMHRLWAVPELARTEAMIYDVGTLGEFGDVPIYYYVMEKMTPAFNIIDEITLKEMITDIVNDIQENYIKELRILRQGPIDNQEKSRLLKLRVRRYATQTAERVSNYSEAIGKIEEMSKDIGLKNGWLITLVEEIIMKFLTGRTDLHIGNLGITGFGEFRYFDPSHQEHQKEFNLGTENDQGDSAANTAA